MKLYEINCGGGLFSLSTLKQTTSGHVSEDRSALHLQTCPLSYREGRAERRALTLQVEQLREELANLRHSYQVSPYRVLYPHD